MKNLDDYFDFLVQFWMMCPYPQNPKQKKEYKNILI